MPFRLPAVLAVVVGLLALTVPAAGASTGPVSAKAKPGAPGSLTGYGFDTCAAPPQAVMDAWWEQSPYSAVGIYIGGSNRLCKDQPELTATWVRTQQRSGWHLLPVQVGPQASCSGYADRMSSDLATAKQQGRAEAARRSRPRRARDRPGSTLYYDLEDYDLAPDDCRRAALSFLSGWTDALHGAGYDSGVYSNIAAAITSLDLADRVAAAYTMPDDIWFAWANGQADTVADDGCSGDRWTTTPGSTSTPSTYLRPTAATRWPSTPTGSTWPGLGPARRGRCAAASSGPALVPDARPGSTAPRWRRRSACCATSASRRPRSAVATTSRPRAIPKAQRRLDLKETAS